MKIGIIDLCKQIEDPSMNRKKVHKMETSIVKKHNASAITTDVIKSSHLCD